MELSKSDVALMMMSGKNSFKMLGQESLVVGYTHLSWKYILTVT